MYSNVTLNDKFLVESRNKRGIYHVTNITPQRFTVGGFTFKKENGNQVGGEAYSTVTIKKATQEMEMEFSLKMKKIKLINELSKVKFEDFSLKQLQQAKNLIDTFLTSKTKEIERLKQVIK